MPKVQNKSNSALANRSLLGPLDRGNGKIIQVVIETPEGSRNKYAFDEQKRIFTLKRVLPAGMAFPYDFGFVPSTWLTMATRSMCWLSWTNPPSPDAL